MYADPRTDTRILCMWDRKNESDTITNMGNWNHLKITGRNT